MLATLMRRMRNNNPGLGLLAPLLARNNNNFKLSSRHLIDEADKRSGYQISQAPPKSLWHIQ